MIFSIFTNICNHCHNLEYFYHIKKKPYALKRTSPQIPPLPNPKQSQISYLTIDLPTLDWGVIRWTVFCDWFFST